MCHSVTLSTFTLLCNHHHHPSPESFSSCKTGTLSPSNNSPFLPPYSPWTFQFSRTIVSDSSPSHGLQHARPPCPSPTPRACSNSCPSSWWCHPTISSSAVPFSSCLQSFPSIRVFSNESVPHIRWPKYWSFSFTEVWVLPINIQGWFPLGLTGLISLQSKRLSRVFSNTTVQKHQFFGAQLSL